jgi:uncharacterized protein (TIGR03083 family)
MGLNPATEPALPDDELDVLAAHALDAVDLDEQLAIEARLLDDERATSAVAVFRRAVGELAAAVDDGTAVAPPLLRDRVLNAALAARPGGTPDVASAPEAHRVEAGRLLGTLARLDDADWPRPVDPPEFAGRSVHDLVAHVAGSEALFAELLGLESPSAPETDNDNDARTAAVQARHRSLTPAQTLAEYEAFAAAIDAHVSTLTEADLETEIEWWGVSMRISTVLIHRAFETWIHHDDVRRAVGLAESAPPAATITTMSRRAVSWLPLMLGAAGHDPSGRTARIELTGPGGDTYLIDLTDGEPLGDSLGGAVTGGLTDRNGRTADDRLAVDVDLRADIVEFCQAIGNRVPAGGLRYESTGDEQLAADLVASLPLLAGL